MVVMGPQEARWLSWEGGGEGGGGDCFSGLFNVEEWRPLMCFCPYLFIFFTHMIMWCYKVSLALYHSTNSSSITGPMEDTIDGVSIKPAEEQNGIKQFLISYLLKPA